MKTVISSGGLGDSFIVFLKIQQYLRENYECSPEQLIHWKHYESNDIVPILCNLIYNSHDSVLSTYKIKCESIFDKNYIETIKKEWDPGNLYFNTSIDGSFSFPAKDKGLQQPFYDGPRESRNMIVVQLNAGAKQNRKWNFNPQQLVKFLQDKGEYVVCIPGIEEIDGCVSSIFYNCKLMISPSGFWTYFALANRIPTIYLSESEEHENHYFHKDWERYKFKMKYGSMKEVIDGLRHFGYKI